MNLQNLLFELFFLAMLKKMNADFLCLSRLQMQKSKKQPELVVITPHASCSDELNLNNH